MDVRMTAGRIRSGEVSAREVVEESLGRIAATQEPLNAFVHVDAEGALAAADDVDRARDASEILGPLAGVPFGVKDLDPLVVGGWRRNKDVTLPQFAKVEAARQGLEMQVAALFVDIDVLITPTNPCPPFAAEGPMPTTIGGQRCHAGTAALLTMFANVANLPAITVPAGATADGLPIGLMITARRHREDICLRLAHIFEQAAPWPLHAPGFA